MAEHHIVRQRLSQLEQILRDHELWQSSPPAEEALQSDQPFSLDTLEPLEWLQWIFIPRMNQLMDAGLALPTNLAVAPYFEMALQPQLTVRPVLLLTLTQLDGLFGQETR